MFNLKKGGLCPACQKGKLDEVKKDFIFTYKKKQRDFQNVKVFKCELCDYEGLTKTTNKKFEKELTDFRRSIDGLLTSDELKQIREMLGLNKKKMAWLLSVNAKTIGRYENGKITQSHQIDKLYRIFQIYPLAVTMFFDDISSITVERPPSIEPKVKFLSSNQTSISVIEKKSAATDNTYFRPKEENILATSSV